MRRLFKQMPPHIPYFMWKEHTEPTADIGMLPAEDSVFRKREWQFTKADARKMIL